MINLQLFVTIYLLGGITFLPLVALAVFYLGRIRNAKNVEAETTDGIRGSKLDPQFKAAEIEEEKGVNVVRQGWLSVTTQYYYYHTEIPSSDACEKTPGTGEVPERSQLKKKHRFYAVIKHGNLFLYRDNSPKSNLIHAISLQDSFVTLWPRNTSEEIADSALFTKRTCISILRKGATFLTDGELRFAPNEVHDDDTSTTSQFFLYIENNIEKEDWYFDLINVSKSDNKGSKHNGLVDPNISARAAHLITADMLYLIQTLNSTESQLTTKWINALLGRLFLALQRTETMKNFLHEKLYQKLSKMKKPDFLGDFVVEEVDVGNSAPLLTNPKLVELSLEGRTRITFDFLYRGHLSVIMSTKATINLGSRFKQREVPLKLSLVLKELSGPVVVLMKPPPSNRIWYTFQTEPILDVEIEPVVSSSKLSYSMITNAIKSKFAEALKESLVEPYWDDQVFYNTENEIYRGGVWENYGEPDKNAKKSSNEGKVPTHSKKASLSKPKKDHVVSEDLQKLSPKSAHTSKGNEDNSPNDDSSIKRRGSQKIESLKRILKTKSSEESDDLQSQRELTSERSPHIEDSDDSEDSANSRKYFKNSIKKIGKWYKEAVTTETSENDVTVHTEKVSGGASLSPEMISNRRTSVPRKTHPPSISHPNLGTTHLNSLPVSPALNSTEMFVNKDKNRSRSSSSNDTEFPSFLSNNYSTMPVRAFVKMKDTREFPGEYLENSSDGDLNSGATKTDNNQGGNK